MKRSIVILGGGFAGQQACNALRRSGERILLVDPNPGPTMLPALPDLAGGWVPERLVQRPFGEILPANVEHLQAAASLIDLEAGTVLAGDQTIAYEQLLIAPGSVPNFYDSPFPREKMHALGTLADARRIRREFEEYLRRTESPHLLVAGTGYTGLELAMSLFFRAKAAGKSCGATIVDPSPILLPSLPDKQRRYVLDFLVAHGAEVRLGVAVESFDGRDAVAGGTTYADVFFCWAAGSKLAVPEIHGRVERLRDGRLQVAADLSLPNYPNVFAAGDAAAIERGGQPLRKAVNFAYYGGRRAGQNIARRRRGRPTRPFRPVDLGWVVPFRETSIGRLPGGLWIRGRLGVRLHHLMCGVRNYSFANFAGCLRLALNPNLGANA
ncbi:MAG TPA: FAD-dependent oxidoreductase [Kiritimatiellia bacterium]|nr:FAD-dependent oxidoreductase [Kiritimatiellia bacterium]